MSAEPPDWREWMRAAQGGDQERYAALLRAILPSLRSAARSRWPAAHASDLEDVVQEALLALHVARHLYDPERPFLPFLFGILRFRGADHFRRRAQHAARESPLHDLPETSAALATKSTQEESLDAGAARALLKRLPAGQRKAIEMTKLKEMSLAEAASVTGESPGALKVATHRGLKTLRRLLQGPE